MKLCLEPRKYTVLTIYRVCVHVSAFMQATQLDSYTFNETSGQQVMCTVHLS